MPTFQLFFLHIRNKHFLLTIIKAWNQAMEPKQENVEPSSMEFKDDPNDWGNVVDSSDDPYEEIINILEQTEDSYYMDWQHFGLSYLFHVVSGSPYEQNNTYDLVFGKNLGVGNNPDGSIHDKVLLNHEEVKRAADFLQNLSTMALKKAFDHQKMVIGICVAIACLKTELDA